MTHRHLLDLNQKEIDFIASLIPLSAQTCRILGLAWNSAELKIGMQHCHDAHLVTGNFIVDFF